MRLIDADVLREQWLINGSNDYVYNTNYFLDSIDEQPTIDAAPVVHGRWIQSKELPNCARCTACNKLTRANGVDRTGNAHVHKAVYIYCPHCGAKMGKE